MHDSYLFPAGWEVAAAAYWVWDTVTVADYPFSAHRCLMQFVGTKEAINGSSAMPEEEQAIA